MPTDRIHATPIDKRDTVSRILAALHRRIVGGKLKAGTPLPPERELAAELGVSRFSLREGLRVAESQGLVEISRGKRTRVVVDSASSVVAAMDLTLRRGIASPLQLTEARLVVEVEVARLAAERMTPDLLAALQQTIDRYEQAAGDVETRVSQDLEFHQLLARASGNPVFEMILSTLGRLILTSQRQTDPQAGHGTLDAHRKILRAVAAGDASAAAKEMRAHLVSVAHALRTLELDAEDALAAAEAPPRARQPAS